MTPGCCRCFFGGGWSGRAECLLSSGFPEALGWVSELLARLGFIQTRLRQPADRVLAGERQHPLPHLAG